MASRTVAVTASAQDVTLTIGERQSAWLYVTNEDGAGRLTFTLNGDTATNGGDDMHFVPPVAGAFRREFVSAGAAGTVTVSIIGSANVAAFLETSKH